MLTVAHQEDHLDFPQLSELESVRTNFLTYDEFARLMNELAKEELWLQAVVVVAANYGLRKSELLGLRVGQVLDRRSS